jgi:hypothetical protein
VLDGFPAAGGLVRVDQPYEAVFTWRFAGEEAVSKTKHLPS